MGKHEASLSDKFDLSVPHQLLSGTQAIVRLVLTQKARDKEAGLNTAGYVTGYRGSPIATIENAFARAQALTSENNIVFHAAVNEDLAATAIWGAQQAELRGEGKYDGVFAIWYGKGPGVDRSGDRRHDPNPQSSRCAGGSRLRALWLRAVTLCGRVGRLEVRQGQFRKYIYGGCQP
jgi:indolepyruvate ferredoxin oxidoreductase